MNNGSFLRVFDVRALFFVELVRGVNFLVCSYLCACSFVMRCPLAPGFVAGSGALITSALIFWPYLRAWRCLLFCCRFCPRGCLLACGRACCLLACGRACCRGCLRDCLPPLRPCSWLASALRSTLAFYVVP